MTDKRDLKDDLNLMQTAYAVALILGFRNVIECLYEVVLHRSGNGSIVVVKVLFSLVLLLTMVRFFWAVGNIRRFITRNASILKETRRYVVSIHFLVLLIHAFSLYCLSKYTLDFSATIPLAEGVRFLVLGYISFLLLNSIWLFVLVRAQTEKEPEAVWIRNNAVTAAVSAVVFLGASFWNPLIGFVLVFLILIGNSAYDLYSTSTSYVSVEK